MIEQDFTRKRGTVKYTAQIISFRQPSLLVCIFLLIYFFEEDKQICKYNKDGY